MKLFDKGVKAVDNLSDFVVCLCVKALGKVGVSACDVAVTTPLRGFIVIAVMMAVTSKITTAKIALPVIKTVLRRLAVACNCFIGTAMAIDQGVPGTFP